MLDFLLDVIKETLVVAGLVLAIMIVIEYINVLTRGLWQRLITDKPWKQYLLAALLGAIPGCMGAYMAVAMFSHKLFTLGATITTMIATSGDEAYLMLAMFPEKAILLTVILVILGIATGFLTDKFLKSRFLKIDFKENEFPIHKQDSCSHYEFRDLLNNILKPKRSRLIFSLALTLLLVGIATGVVIKDAEPWMYYTIVFAAMVVLLILLSVPAHFIEEHLWNHIIKIHLPRIVLWTFAVLVFIKLLLNHVNLDGLVTENMIMVLIAAVLIGIIPQSGPHLVFVTLFAQGAIPFSILLANSISQDGHGMLPLFGESRKAFFIIKFIKVILALIVGFAMFGLGF